MRNISPEKAEEVSIINACKVLKELRMEGTEADRAWLSSHDLVQPPKGTRRKGMQYRKPPNPEYRCQVSGINQARKWWHKIHAVGKRNG